MSTKKKSMDLYLAEVVKQFISIKDEDYKKSQVVFKSVFDQVKQKMGEQCNYFKKYSSQVLYAGSVYDGLKIGKMDEFDMNIVIRLPINYGDGENGIIIEKEQPGFIKMKIVNAFDHLDNQKEWENCHKVTREWRDSDKYFLQNKFRQWLQGIITGALNNMKGQATVNDVVYMLEYKHSGPAYTLNVRNDEEKFSFDVDLVPVIKFVYPRVPEGFRVIEGIQAKDWLVVPKPNKAINDKTLRDRCWRLSFQEQEREIIKGCLALKTTIRLVKKLRDALEMKAIASYYIKTLFLWKVIEKNNDKTYWQGKVSFLFQTMVEELYNAIKNKNIPYFWNKSNNLIGNLKPTLQKLYSDRLKDLLASIAVNDTEKVVTYLLTKAELKEFKSTDFYLKQANLPNITPQMSAVEVTPKLSLSQNVVELNNEVDQIRARYPDLETKLNDLADRISLIEDRLQRLEERDLQRQRQTFTDSENSIRDL